MKRELICCALGALGAAIAATSQAAPLTLVEEGVAQVEIVLDLAQPQRQLEYAASELTNWLGRISGAAQYHRGRQLGAL